MSRPSKWAIRFGAAGLLIGVLFASRGTWPAPGSAQDYVAVPVETVEQIVMAGERRALPWGEVGACDDPLPAGCVAVESIASGAVTLRFERFKLKDGILQPSRLTYTAQVTPAALSYPLYTLENGGETFWIYAALASQRNDAATIRFLKLRAFVTEAAALHWDVTLDETQGLYRETTRIEAREPVTLIGLRDIGRVLPGGRLRGVWVDEARVRFAYAGILNLNLPAGSYEVVAEATWQPKEGAPVCLGPVYEGRKMSLPRRTDLRITSNKKTTVTLRPIGLPAEVWQGRKLLLAADPEPLARNADETGITLVFGGDASLSLLPVIVYQNATFPVLVCLVFSGV